MLYIICYNLCAEICAAIYTFLFREPLNNDVAGHWRNDVMKKIACPISYHISSGTTFVHYKKELDDPYKTAEVQGSVTSFKLNQTGRIMSQASGT